MFRLVVLAATLAVAAAAHAQSPPADLGRCLADNTTGRDRKDLARWMFLGMAAHPEITQYASAAAAAANEESSRMIGALVTRLLTDACANQTRAAIRTGGAAALQLAFQSLGQAAMQELMTDKAVSTSLGRFEQYLDRKRFDELMAVK